MKLELDSDELWNVVDDEKPVTPLVHSDDDVADVSARVGDSVPRVRYREKSKSSASRLPEAADLSDTNFELSVDVFVVRTMRVVVS